MADILHLPKRDRTGMWLIYIATTASKIETCIAIIGHETVRWA